MAEKKKRQWSKEAKERYSKMMKERYGVDKSPMPSIIREQEYRDNPKFVNQEEIISEGSGEEMKTDNYIAKRSFDYDTGISFEHGQIVELRGMPNDDKLVRLGYVVPYTPKDDDNECIKCGKKFGSTSGYIMHTASHYEKCGICGRSVPPEDTQKHHEAHAVLA